MWLHGIGGVAGLRAAAGTPEFGYVLTAAGKTLDQGGNMDAVAWLLPAWLATGDERYSQRAVQYSMESLTGEEEKKRLGQRTVLELDSGFWYRTVMRNFVMVYDWAHDLLTLEQRKRIAVYLMDAADAVRPETNGGKEVWAVVPPAPENNYWHGANDVTLAAWALDPADDPRVELHRRLGVEHYEREWLAWMESPAAVGGSVETPNYSPEFRVASFIDALRSFGGPDWTSRIRPWLDDTIRLRIHSTVPTLNERWVFGDEPGTFRNLLGDEDRKKMLGAVAFASPELASAGAHWLNTISHRRCTNDPNLIWEVLYKPKAAPVDYTATWPREYLATGSGRWFYRTDWDSDALMVGAWAGPMHNGHQPRSLNEFNVYRRGWVLMPQCLWSEGGTETETYATNNVTIGDKGQQWTNAAFDHGHVIQAGGGRFVGQGKCGYKASGILCRDFRRDIIVHSPDLITVRDTIDADGPRMLHLHEPLNAEYRPHLTNLTPLLPFESSVREQISLGTQPYHAEFHTKIVSQGGFSLAIQIVQTGGTPPALATLDLPPTPADPFVDPPAPEPTPNPDPPMENGPPNWRALHGTLGYCIPLGPQTPGLVNVIAPTHAGPPWPDGASCWYGNAFSLDVNAPGLCRLSLWVMDGDQNGRAQRVEVLAASGQVAAWDVADFATGKWLECDIASSVTVTVLNTGPTNAVLGGVFLDPASAPPPAQWNEVARTVLHEDTLVRVSLVTERKV